MTTAHDSYERNIAHTGTLTERFPQRSNRRDAIRRKCIDCTVGQIAEIARCEMTDCALWPFRMGNDPFRKKRGNSEDDGEGEAA